MGELGDIISVRNDDVRNEPRVVHESRNRTANDREAVAGKIAAHFGGIDGAETTRIAPRDGVRIVLVSEVKRVPRRVKLTLLVSQRDKMRVDPFVTGFGDPRVTIERPADVAFSPDGRLFFSVDQGNKVYWVAPTTLRMPAR